MRSRYIQLGTDCTSVNLSRFQNYVLRMNAPEDDGQLTQHTAQTLLRMAQSMSGQAKVCLMSWIFILHSHQKQKDYEEDFLISKPTHYEYIQRLQRWRDKYEKALDARPRVQPLDVLSHYLTEFQYSKVDEIEVPGQYIEVCILKFWAFRHLWPSTGQGQQPELCQDPKVCAQIWKLPISWYFLETIYSSRQWQLKNFILCATSLSPTMSPWGKGHADFPHFQWVWLLL
jgi:hypothetical protein